MEYLSTSAQAGIDSILPDKGIRHMPTHLNQNNNNKKNPDIQATTEASMECVIFRSPTTAIENLSKHANALIYLS